MGTDGKKVFWHYGTGFSFPVPVLGTDGKQEYKYDKNGNNKLPVEKIYKFIEVNKKGDKGLCSFVYDPATMPANVLTELQKYVKDPVLKVMTEEEYRRNLNPAAYDAKREKEAIEKKASTLEEENKRLKDELERARRRN